jgi:hypothetical protein
MPVDERATEAFGHLQRALLEMIQAARATLDLVEDIVAEPQTLAATIAGIARLVAAASASHAAPDEPAQSGVERIPIR